MQLLSKSKLPLKIIKIFMVFVLFFSLVIQKPKETHAFPLALLLPAVTNPATVTTVLGFIGIGAVGTATNGWYEENYAKLEQTAITTVGQMSNDMYNNLQKSIENMLYGTTNGIEIAGDVLTNLFNSLKDTFNSTIDNILLPPGITRNGGKFSNTEFFDFMHNSTRYRTKDITFSVAYSGNYINFRALQTSGTILEERIYYTTDERDSILNAWDTLYSNPNTSLWEFMTFYNQYLTNQLGLTLDGVTSYPSAVPTSSMELDNVGDYVTDTLLTNQNKLGLNLGINDLVNLRTNEGVPLYVDNLGQVVLRDGRPFEGDLENIVVSHRVPTVTDVAGTLTPTISTDFGMVNIKTGEIVVPNPNPPTPNPPNNIKPETTKPLTGIQRFLPAAVVIVFILFLKAIVFYAIRLFDFILTLPLTPSKPINNYAFQWFMDAKILGIQVYDTVLAFAMFAFSLTIYKVIRRIW